MLVPMENVKKADLLAFNKDMKPVQDFDRVQSRRYPIIENASVARPFLVEINGLSGILASTEDSPESLAEYGEMEVSKFRKYNDLNLLSRIEPDAVYYLEAKRGKAKIHYHTVELDENIWQISQRYGIKLVSLVRKNRLEKGEEPKPGRILWLRKKRPANQPVEYRQIQDVVARGVIREQKVPIVEEEIAPDNIKNEKETLRDTEEVALKDKDDALKEFEKEFKTATEKSIPLSKDITGDEVNDNIEENRALKDEAKYLIHTVKQGETLYSISRQYGLNAVEISEWNSIDDSQQIKIDQQLKILKQAVKGLMQNGELNEGESYIYHEVTKGDTLYNIAKQYDVTIELLIQWNNKQNAEIRLGERLTIKKSDD